MVQALFGAWLAQLRPLRGRAVEVEDVPLQIEFVRRKRIVDVRIVAASAVPSLRASHLPRRIHATAGREAPRFEATAPRPAPAERTAERPLDLTVPSLPERADAEPRAPFERTASRGHEPTRFDRAWMPAGTALEQGAFHSAVVRAPLALFGGPPRRCTEVERRLRRINCLPLHGEDEEREALLRSLDR
ncbi:hypothetical protein [Lysobacter xanthus]